MASIFKKSIVKEKAQLLQVDNFNEKIEVIESWYNSYLNRSLHNKNERQCEQEFINDIFKRILGYTSFPSEPHTLIPQITSEVSAQRPDVGLGFFSNSIKNVFAVVEIKDVNTLLDQSQRREGNLTPIQQAFKYKPQFKDCRFVIATNLYEIRLFQDNQLDYETFTLKSLASPDNDYFELKRFILLLSQENFVAEKGRSKTEDLLAEIRVEQEKITKQFYEEYSNLRLKLMRDIWKNNVGARNINFVADKAQKILDRIVFVCFCEDSGLLPDNTLLNIYNQAGDSYLNFWDSLKVFFKAVDSGNEKLGIPNGYNGGLFQQDDDLDKLQVSDEACRSLGRIGQYDYENELTVNVLGHVFEKSITDLEEIKQKVEPDQENQKSKRKNDGIFYTPEYIVSFIVHNSLGRYLKENEERIFKEFKLDKATSDKTYRERELKALSAYQSFLQKVKVVDPACGSGAFLVKVFDYLLAENNRIGIRIGSLFDQDRLFREILSNNIYGVDLNEESVRITQLSLWLKTAQKGKKLTHLDKNIRCGNSIVEDEDLIGAKAFVWKKEFKEVFDEGGFDVVVGNPPYVNSKHIKSEERKYFWERYQNYLQMDLDLYEIFLIKSIMELVKHGGMIGFITPNSYFTGKSFELFRKLLIDETNILNIVDFPYRFFPFSDVNTETSILISCKNKGIGDLPQINIVNKREAVTKPLNEHNPHASKIPLFKSNNMFVINISETANKVITRTESIKFKDHFILSNPSSLDRKDRAPETKHKNYDQCVFTDDEIRNDTELINIIHPALEGNNVLRYLLHGPKKHTNIVSKSGKSLDDKIINLMHRPKIVSQRITGQARWRIVATFDDQGLITMPSLNIILSIKDDTDELKKLLGIINSQFYNYLYKQIFGESNTNITSEVFNTLPIPDKFSQSDLNLLVDEILKSTKYESELLKSSIDFLNSEFGLQLGPKQNDIFKLEWSLFNKLVSNKSVYDSEKLFSWYRERQSEINTAEIQTKKLDRQIELKVYKLFQLTDSEITSVENEIRLV